jgi:hypothetical protein
MRKLLLCLWADFKPFPDLLPDERSKFIRAMIELVKARNEAALTAAGK